MYCHFSNISIGLADVERAFVHVDYEDSHNISTEHKALYEVEGPKIPLLQRIKQKMGTKKKDEEVAVVE